MKRTIHDNYRLEIEPDTWHLHSSIAADHDAMRFLLTGIERSVRRHVDGVGQIVPRWDTRHECSHCGYEWEELTAEEAADLSTRQDEHSIAGEPVCCRPAIDEFRAAHGVPLLAQAGGAG